MRKNFVSLDQPTQALLKHSTCRLTYDLWRATKAACQGDLRRLGAEMIPGMLSRSSRASITTTTASCRRATCPTLRVPPRRAAEVSATSHLAREKKRKRGEGAGRGPERRQEVCHGNVGDVAWIQGALHMGMCQTLKTTRQLKKRHTRLKGFRPTEQAPIISRVVVLHRAPSTG